MSTISATISSLQGMQERGLVTVDYPTELRGAVEACVASWTDFCALPRGEKCAITFVEDDHGDGAGYELKEGSGQDSKENFHFTRSQSRRLTQMASGHTLTFLENTTSLLDKIEPLVVQFAQQMEDAYQLVGFVEDVKSSKPYWTVRLLHYFGDQEEGAEIAAPHIDKGGFTLHLYESEEGLQYLSFEDKVWKPMPVSQNQTVIISAAQLQLQSKTHLKALYHRVVATKTTASVGRFSMVCFITMQQTPLYNKGTHGSMQSHPIGFNYTMPHEAFAKLFSS